ncbi:hypothetical protein CMV_004228 [Castanea mollissima]|uniref:Uncharacterized protein n=1 Tax=Castanea mollissima TaxID=60419 RepID=A0A8J4RFX6_9ROSI|nr:hypothetical protein CMV_004228 [Castanea mollissima]
MPDFLLKSYHEDGVGEIGAEREVEEAGVVVELGEVRSEGGTGDVVLDETVNVNDGGSVVELNAGHEEEDNGPLCVVTLKAKAVIVDGVSRVEEDEEPLDPSIRRDCMAEPEKILSSVAESRVLRRAKEGVWGARVCGVRRVSECEGGV